MTQLSSLARSGVRSCGLTCALAFALSLGLLGPGGAAEFKATTVHLCGGIYAHQHNAGAWQIYGGKKDLMASASGKSSIKDLLATYCPNKPHPEIHEEHL